MAYICVYPDGSVTSSPRPDMSDDFFLVEECEEEGKLYRMLEKHFGRTRQCIEVFCCILGGQY